MFVCQVESFSFLFTLFRMLEENEDVFLEALKQDLNKPVQVSFNPILPLLYVFLEALKQDLNKPVQVSFNPILLYL